ncbi:MAG: ACT domain-containing protein [Erysipelotrichaceae bacterium]|nr:ACT domain-containing protein [Erysipelotrichaceae bacterium]
MDETIMKRYLIVSEDVVPEYFLTVIRVRKALEEHQYDSVSDACKAFNISRSTFYKYKNEVFLPEETSSSRKAVLAMTLSHEAGVLSKVLNELSTHGLSVLTISQAVPMGGKANVIVSVDITDITSTIDHMMEEVSGLNGVLHIDLLSIE